MPAYQNTTPPISLMPGDVGFSFNNEAFPGSAQAGSQFAIPGYAGQPDTGTAVRWQTIFGTASTAVSMVLQGAMADVDAENQTIMDRLNQSGDLFLTHTKLNGKLMLRLSVGQMNTQEHHVENAWKRIREEAQKLNTAV